MEGRKEARVCEFEGQKILNFNKGRTSHLPPVIFFGAVACRVVRNGVRQSLKLLKEKNLATKGIAANELEIGDKVVLDYVDDVTFYQTLRDHGRVTPGVFVWLDPELETSLKNLRAPAWPHRKQGRSAGGA
jgi:hypothetical protein